ncbi:50S ribosomal protein L9 [Candidatus Zinderia endosymbiont of Aphrophora alni]|uniref:50S ribosomal protein L9 n=1 Tax=Candidatus Zinderia endosymbiont of Aphrophora alni TaxID=3077951 RepID=UPI0030CDA16D
MKIILLKQFNNLGKFTDIISVKNGYARNFLIPKKIACIANNINIIKYKLKKSEIKKIIRKKKKKYKKIAEKIKNLNIKIYKKSSFKGNLLNYINKNNILLELRKKKIFIEKDQIKLPYKFIKKIGNYKIPIYLFSNINSILSIFVFNK